MIAVKGKAAVQNESLVDRFLRVLLGVIMLAVPCYLLLETGAENQIWLSLSMLFSVYPILSGIIGMDPLYNLFNKKTCDLSDHNRCGNFTSQLDAFFGHKHA